MSEAVLALVRGALPAPAPPGADSLLIRGERVLAVATEAAVRAEAGPGARVVDLGGRQVGPGFHDAHFHFLQSGIFAARPDLRPCRDRDEVLAAVEGAHRDRPGAELLLLENYDETGWPEPRAPTRRELDRIDPNRPLVLRRVDGHTAVANSAGAARLAAYAPEDVDPETGRCRERAVLELDERFPPARDEIRDAFAAAAARCFAVGITTTCDFLRRGACAQYADAFPGGPDVPDLDLYLWPECGAEDIARLPLSGALRHRGIKLFADGSVGARAAAMFAGYADRPEERGILFYEDHALHREIRRGHDAGFQVAVHAIGDRAIAQVVAAFAALPREEIRDRGHRIEHFELPREEEIRAVAAIGVRPCVQPNFVGNWSGPGGLYETALGSDRLRAMNPFRRLLDLETGVFFGSDGMPASPRYGIRSAMRHPVREQRLTEAEATRLYT
ncbi:MAG: amidohydrolase family protein, partial [Gemmatimonadetes bacterium]|nr:amidohydrolase family protein [Gemmatimonadota bacterium]